MTENEFDVLDELYFVISYDDLRSSVELSEHELIMTLESLWKNGWLRVLANTELDEDESKVNIASKYRSYFYLASKKGLFAHNSN